VDEKNKQKNKSNSALSAYELLSKGETDFQTETREWWHRLSSLRRTVLEYLKYRRRYPAANSGQLGTSSWCDYSDKSVLGGELEMLAWTYEAEEKQKLVSVVIICMVK